MKSLRSALRVLMEFTSGKPSYTVTELAAQTGLSKSHISKIAAALADAQLIRQDPASQAFSVAVRSFVLGSQFFNQDDLCGQALPLLRDLTEQTGHSTRLSMLDGDRAAYLIGINGPLFTDSPWKIGTYMPIHATSAGRVLLAFMAEDDMRALLRGPLRKITQETIVDPETLLELLRAVREHGFSASRDENTVGLGAVSVPVFDAHRVVIGALSIAFPSHNVARSEEAALLAPLQRAARTLSQRLGCPVYPYGSAR
ncbi:IclR family transcriptional regulator [Caballeronia sp. LZ035]|uniref:IclR family transcriptional regulator n=1 Tax=Caballeronia sp. LZ035 TaxID=3038568 RepID=UPI002854D446|nr:IclR family transcriptional regulator [Caballeronia sp. LZ035]MDR5760720.1 IclR family transcriptional regulator [Caballeronia sp. LZ035]